MSFPSCVIAPLSWMPNHTTRGRRQSGNTPEPDIAAENGACLAATLLAASRTSTTRASSTSPRNASVTCNFPSRTQRTPLVADRTIAMALASRRRHSSPGSIARKSRTARFEFDADVTEALGAGELDGAKPLVARWASAFRYEDREAFPHFDAARDAGVAQA